MILAEIIESSITEDSYDCLVNGELVATVQYDWANDGATQPWIVVIGSKVVHAANTQNRAINWVNWHLKNGTLPFAEPAAIVVERECIEVGVMAYPSDVTEVFVVLVPENKMIGVVGHTDSGWWSVPSSSISGLPIRSISCKEVVQKLVVIEGVLSKPEVFVYKIVIDNAEENIIRKTREFTSDEEAVKYARDLSRDYLDAVEVRVSRQVAPRRWVTVL